MLTLYLEYDNSSVFAMVFTYLSPSLDCELAKDKNLVWFLSLYLQLLQQHLTYS